MSDNRTFKGATQLHRQPRSIGVRKNGGTTISSPIKRRNINRHFRGADKEEHRSPRINPNLEGDDFQSRITREEQENEHFVAT